MAEEINIIDILTVKKVSIPAFTAALLMGKSAHFASFTPPICNYGMTRRYM